MQRDLRMKATFTIHRKFTVGPVDDRLFGGFVEHIGRCVYDGIYEPGHPEADEDGFRRDVAALVRELNMPVTRYPGGNFVSGYDWHDTIGPKENRPVRAEYAWEALEPNQVGIDEFVRWCRKVNTAPMLAVNLGTGTAKSAQELVEYCNFPQGTRWSDLRRKNGAETPHGIRLWCLGNEMDGPWQIGHKSAEEYARIAHESGKMMKMADPSIELVVCGSSTRSMPTFATWDAAVLRETFEIADYLALHAYFGWKPEDEKRMAFFASPELLEKQICDLIAVCDFIAAEKKSTRRISLALDEWNIWYRGNPKAHPETRWQVARPVNEETYDMADVIVAGGLLMAMLDHADRLKIGCLAQTVNVIAPIMTRPGGGAWRQTIYYPFYYTSRYGRGTVLQSRIDSPSYALPECARPVNWVRCCAILREKESEITLFAINRSTEECAELVFEMNGFTPEQVEEAVEIHHDNLGAINTETREEVAPAAIDPDCYELTPAELQTTLKPASWNMFRIKVKNPGGEK